MTWLSVLVHLCCVFFLLYILTLFCNGEKKLRKRKKKLNERRTSIKEKLNVTCGLNFFLFPFFIYIYGCEKCYTETYVVM